LTRAIKEGVASISMPPAQAASAPLAAGQIKPRFCCEAASAAGSTPATMVTAASSDNSPSAT